MRGRRPEVQAVLASDAGGQRLAVPTVWHGLCACVSRDSTAFPVNITYISLLSAMLCADLHVPPSPTSLQRSSARSAAPLRFSEKKEKNTTAIRLGGHQQRLDVHHAPPPPSQSAAYLYPTL